MRSDLVHSSNGPFGHVAWGSILAGRRVYSGFYCERQKQKWTTVTYQVLREKGAEWGSIWPQGAGCKGQAAGWGRPGIKASRLRVAGRTKAEVACEEDRPIITRGSGLAPAAHPAEAFPHPAIRCWLHSYRLIGTRASKRRQRPGRVRGEAGVQGLVLPATPHRVGEGSPSPVIFSKPALSLQAVTTWPPCYCCFLL